MRRLTLAALGCLAVSAACSAPLLEQNGELGPGSEKLKSGEFGQLFTVAVPAGQYIEARLQAEGFDPYLIALLPSGGKLTNNDFDGSDSQISFVSPAAGELKLVVTTTRPGERGQFRLVVDARPADGPMTTVLDRVSALTPDDDKLPGGELSQALQVQVKAGQILRARLDSDAIDPYLVMVIDGRGRLENNDFEGNSSELACRIPTDGLVKLVVTSKVPAQTGQFHLTIQTDGNGSVLMSSPGKLSAASPKLPDGEFFALHRLAVAAGQKLHVTVTSEGFEGYLLVIPPGGKQFDVRSTTPGKVETDVTCPQAGELQVVVTSVKPGAQGDYRIEVRSPDAARPTVPPATTAVPDPPPAVGAGPVTLESIGAGTPDFNPEDPRLRKPSPQPDAAAAQNPGLLAETLHRRNSVMIVLKGVHQWRDEAYEFEAGGRERTADKSGDQYEKIELYSHHFEHLENLRGEGDLQWTGNVFTAHWAVEVREQVWWDQPYAYTNHDLRVIDITGVVDPSGDRIERIDFDFYQSWKTIDRKDNKHEYKHQEVSRIVLTDLPFNAYSWLYPERPEQPYSLSGAVARLRQKAAGRALNLDHERIIYEVQGPDSRDHLLSFTHRICDPAFGAQSMFGGNLHTKEWKNTNWLSKDPEPSITVMFYNAAN